MSTKETFDNSLRYSDEQLTKVKNMIKADPDLMTYGEQISKTTIFELISETAYRKLMGLKYINALTIDNIRKIIKDESKPLHIPIPGSTT